MYFRRSVIFALLLGSFVHSRSLLDEASDKEEAGFAYDEEWDGNSDLCSWGGRRSKEYPWAEPRSDGSDRKYYCRMTGQYNIEGRYIRNEGQGVDLVLYGDSIFQCCRYGANNCKGVTAWYGRNWGKRYNTVNWALGSDTIESLFWRVLAGNWVDNTTAVGNRGKQVALVYIGSNDLGGSEQDMDSLVKTAEQTADRLKDMMSFLMQQNSNLYVVHLGLLPKTDYDERGRPTFMMSPGNEAGIKRFNQVMREYGRQEERVRYVECYDPFVREGRQINKWLMDEGLHPNENGFRQLQRCVEPFIEQYLDVRAENGVNYNDVVEFQQVSTRSIKGEDKP